MNSLMPMYRVNSHKDAHLIPTVFFLLCATYINLTPIWTAFVGISGNLIFLFSSLTFIVLRIAQRSGRLATVVMLSLLGLATASVIILSLSLLLNIYIFISLLALLVMALAWCGSDRIRIITQPLRKISISKKLIQILILMLLLSFLHSLYWQAITAKIILYISISLFVASYFNKSILIKFVDASTFLHFAIVICAIVGFLYSASGGEALFSIVNEDGRENGFYLTTFSNTYLFGFIRPSGIYDEPGALSFMLCAISLLRDALGLDRRRTLLLLFLGLVTSSVAHLIFLIFYIVAAGIRNQIKFLIYSLVFLTLILAFDVSVLSVVNEFSSRLTIVDGSLSGDNRSDLLNNAISYLSTSVAFFGLDSNCILNNSSCESMNYLKYGENPLTPIVHYGILLSLPYYTALILLIFFAIRVRSLAAFGFALILLQRPYVLSYGYTLIIVICIYAMQLKLTEIKGLRRL